VSGSKQFRASALRRKRLARENNAWSAEQRALDLALEIEELVADMDFSVRLAAELKREVIEALIAYLVTKREGFILEKEADPFHFVTTVVTEDGIETTATVSVTER